MTAYNVVRFCVKPGREKDFEQSTRDVRQHVTGFRRFSLIKTGDRTYCIIGEWDSMDTIAKNRSDMIKRLDSFRDMLEDLGGEFGVTDAVSGEAVVEVS